MPKNEKPLVTRLIEKAIDMRTMHAPTAMLFEEAVAELDLVRENKLHIAGCALVVLIVPDDVGLVAVAGKMETALIRDIAVAVARGEPGGIGEGQTLESNIGYGLSKFSLTIHKNLKHRKFDIGCCEVFSPAGDIV